MQILISVYACSMQQGLAEWPGEGSCVASDNNLRRFLCHAELFSTNRAQSWISSCAILRAVHERVLLGTGWMPQSGRGHSRPLTIIICTSARACVWVAQRHPTFACTRTMAMGFFLEECGHKATCLCKEHHTSLLSFCRTVAERLRQQWHDLASSPGPWDEARLSLSFNWMQTSLLAPSYDTITNSSVTQTGRIS